MNQIKESKLDRSWTTALSRVPRSHRQARATYDRISRWYDLLEGNWERAPKALALRQLRVRTAERILEIGCGTGHILCELAKETGASGQVTGIDLSRRMLAISSARLAQASLPRVTLENADATQLPFQANAFDVVFVSFVLELFDTPEIPVVLAECRRVLCAGGRLAVVSLSKAGDGHWMRALYEWGHTRFPNVLDCRPILVQAALEDMGFQVLEALLVSLWGLPVEIVTASKLE